MANNIELAKVYTKITDDIYKEASLTSDLDGAAELMREGYNADEIVIPMIDMDGLGDYDRNSGYVNGDVTLEWETVKCNYDRGRMFQVDNLDNVETGGVAFGKLAGEFMRTKTIPELDAERFACYASKTGIGTTNATLTTGAQVISALRAASNEMDELEVPYEGRILYITPTLAGLVDDLDTTKSRAVMARFSKIVKVPQTRFYTAITKKDGKTEGDEAGGYTAAADAQNINFLIVHKAAPIQFIKHVAPKIINPENNQSSDAWKYGYRIVGITGVYANKLAGVYCHTGADVTPVTPSGGAG